MDFYSFLGHLCIGRHRLLSNPHILPRQQKHKIPTEQLSFDVGYDELFDPKFYESYGGMGKWSYTGAFWNT